MRRSRRYLGASTEEGAISARAAKKALSPRELRRRRYLGSNSKEGAISVRAPKKALSRRDFFFLQFCRLNDYGLELELEPNVRNRLQAP